MTTSQASRALCGLLIAGAVFVAPLYSARAADNPSTNARSGAVEQNPVTFPTAPLPEPVVVGQLGVSEGAAVGLFDDSNGLGQEMWSGANRAALADELSRIPIVSVDPVVRGLSRRLLLTRAEIPPGTAPHAIITIRIERLLDGGMIDEAAAMANAANVPNDPEFDRVRAEALLYAQSPEVCGDKTKSRLANSDTFWLELRAYCYAAANDMPAVDLTREIFEAQGSNDTGFLTLLDDIENEHRVPAGQFLHATPVDIFMLRKLGQAVSPSIAAQLGTAADLIAARDLKNPPIERLTAAQHIVWTGAIDAQDLAAIADSQSFAEGARMNAADAARSVPFLMGQSLIRQAAESAKNPAVKLSLVMSADPRRSGAGPFALYASLQASDLALVSPPTIQNDPDVARLLLLGGFPDAAERWLKMPTKDTTSAEMTLALDLAEPGPQHDTRAKTAMAWLVNRDGGRDTGHTAMSALALGIDDALGHPWMPPSVSAAPDGTPPGLGPTSESSPVAPLVFVGEEPSSGIEQQIDRIAADPSRRGEALLLLLDTLGAKGPARFAPDADVYFIQSLAKLGLTAAAKQLAIECLLLGPVQPDQSKVAAPVSMAQP